MNESTGSSGGRSLSEYVDGPFRIAWTIVFGTAGRIERNTQDSVPDPFGSIAIASSAVATGVGSFAWNDIEGNVMWANIDHGKIVNLRSWRSGLSGLATNLEPGYADGNFLLPMSSEPYTEVVDLDSPGSPIRKLVNNTGADDSGSPQIGLHHVYIPDTSGVVDEFTIDGLFDPSKDADRDVFSLPLGAKSLTDIMEQDLPNAAGQTVPSLTFSTEAGLQIFQNNPNVSATLSVNTTTPTGEWSLDVAHQSANVVRPALLLVLLQRAQEDVPRHGSIIRSVMSGSLDIDL